MRCGAIPTPRACVSDHTIARRDKATDTPRKDSQPAAGAGPEHVLRCVHGPRLSRRPRRLKARPPCRRRDGRTGRHGGKHAAPRQAQRDASERTERRRAMPRSASSTGIKGSGFRPTATRGAAHASSFLSRNKARAGRACKIGWESAAAYQPFSVPLHVFPRISRDSSLVLKAKAARPTHPSFLSNLVFTQVTPLHCRCSVQTSRIHTKRCEIQMKC